MRLLLAFTFCLLPFALQAQPQTISAKPLRDYYFVGQGLQLRSGINCFAITDRERFDKFFGKTRRPDTPSFEKEVMLVMLMKESNRESKLTFERVDVKAGNFIEVYVSSKINEGKTPYKIYPIAVCTIPKVKGVAKLNFYDKGSMKLIQTVMLKEER